jgi:cysteine desulfurase/selenocysteine lyase
MIDVKRVRKDFPALKNEDFIYLDNAATSLTPEPVTQELINYYHELGTSVHRGIYKKAEVTTNKLEKARKKTADFIGAGSSREIVFTKNCTESLNLLAYSFHHWEDKEGKILVTEMDHHSNILPWRIMAESSNRFQLEYVRVNKEGQLDLEDLEAKLSHDSVAVAFPAVSNVIGAYNPVKKLTNLAHENGALAILDGAQWMPHRQFNVRNYNIDFLTFSAHKMLGPTGLGILYGKEELLEQMPPPFGGGEMVRSSTKTEVTWNEIPQKFEAGTPPIAQIIAFRKTLDYLDKLGMTSIREHVNKLTAKALKELEKIPDLQIYGPGKGKERGGLVSFNLEGIHPHDLATALDSLDHIAIRAGLHCAQPLHEAMKLNATSRASFYVYNDEAEIDRLADAIIEAKNVLGSKNERR